MELFIIDGIGPFFQSVTSETINWSKINFSQIEENDRLTPQRCTEIQQGFRQFIAQAATAGYNTITLDDMAHLCTFPFYSSTLKQKIEDYRQLYLELFTLAEAAGMKILITTDLLFYNEAIAQHIGDNDEQLHNFALNSCRQLLEWSPAIHGIIFRIGEADGLDVQGDFQSRLILQRPAQARRLLETLLPLFEELDRLLIFRTWSVGVGPIGDIIWNPHTFDALFKGINSPQLILSMKYGTTDFFRFLPLNRLFFHSPHRKLIELQTRREYEGFGEYPSFVGYDYEHFRNQLSGAQNMAGISVWCQTGGWSGFRKLTWLENSSIWTEINTFVTVRLFRDNLTTDQAIQQFYRHHFNHHQWRPLQELLQLSDQVIKELLYIDEFANRTLFFRRLRVPPLVHVYWKHIIANHFMRKFLRCYITNGPEKVEQGHRALTKIDRMIALAEELQLPSEGLHFQHDTFALIAAVRAYYFLPYTESTLKNLQQLKTDYEAQHPEPRYNLMIDTTRLSFRRTHLALMLRIFFRGEHGYRLLDRIVTLNLLSLLYPLLKRLHKRSLPKFASETAMGIDTIFK